MSQNIQFQAGHPQKFIATKTFALGASGVNVPPGGEVEFDGVQVWYGGFPPVPMPTLRGALRLGWLVPAEDYDPEAAAVRPVSAGVQIRSAQGGNPMEPKPRTPITTVDDEEREVASVKHHSQQTTTRNASNYRRDGNHPNVEVEAQDGVAVRRVTTPTKQVVNFEKESPQAAISRAEKVKVQPGQGRTRDEMLASMPEAEREQYMAEINARKAAYVDEPIVVAQVKKASTVQKEGFTVTNSVGGGTNTVDLAGLDTPGENQVMTTEVDGIKFTNTNGPKKETVRLVPKKASVPAPEPGSVDDDTCRKIAKAVCPDFPDNYVFSEPLRKKIARLQADYEDRPDVIRAVAAAETDPEVKRRLVEEFPEAFG